MQETHSVEAEMKIHIKSQSVLCTGAVEVSHLSGFPGTLKAECNCSCKMGKRDSFRVRIQPPALRAGAPLTGVSCPVALPSGCLRLYSQMAASLGNLFSYHKFLARRFSSAPLFIKTIGPGTKTHLCKLPLKG